MRIVTAEQGLSTRSMPLSQRRDFYKHCAPSVVLELLARLEEKEQDVAKVDGVAQFWISQAAEWKQRTEAAEQRLLHPVVIHVKYI